MKDHKLRERIKVGVIVALFGILAQVGFFKTVNELGATLLGCGVAMIIFAFIKKNIDEKRFTDNKS